MSHVAGQPRVISARVAARLGLRPRMFGVEQPCLNVANTLSCFLPTEHESSLCGYSQLRDDGITEWTVWDSVAAAQLKVDDYTSAVSDAQAQLHRAQLQLTKMTELRARQEARAALIADGSPHEWAHTWIRRIT